MTTEVTPPPEKAPCTVCSLAVAATRGCCGARDHAPRTPLHAGRGRHRRACGPCIVPPRRGWRPREEVTMVSGAHWEWLIIEGLGGKRPTCVLDATTAHLLAAPKQGPQ